MPRLHLSSRITLLTAQVLITPSSVPPAHSLWSRILEEGGRVSSHPRARADALYAGDSLLHVGAGADRHGGVAEAGCRPWCVGARHILRAGVHA